MLGTFDALRKNFTLKPKWYVIDNLAFRMHYRVSALIFLVSTILVTSRQYIGEHIRCISDSGVPAHVMNTFCFFTSTFTLIRDYDEDALISEQIPHPGVGPHGFNSTEPIKRHAYYQWVPFVLFGQAIMFTITHIIWKKWEGGRLKLLCDALRYTAFAFNESKDINVRGMRIPSKKEKEDKIELIKRVFLDRVYINSSWSQGLIVCEVLNLFHVILQIYITNEFLGGEFMNLGVDVMENGLEAKVDILEKVFPKVTKCTFYKYGPSGSIQLHDAMCVMALNIMNEKIYIILWFWFIILFSASLLAILWRITTIVLHAKSKKFNQIVFSNVETGKLNPWRLLTITRYCSYTDWLFLKYIQKNTDPIVFKDLLMGLADDLDERFPIENSDNESHGTLEKVPKYD